MDVDESGAEAKTTLSRYVRTISEMARDKRTEFVRRVLHISRFCPSLLSALYFPSKVGHTSI